MPAYLGVGVPHLHALVPRDATRLSRPASSTALRTHTGVRIKKNTRREVVHMVVKIEWYTPVVSMYSLHFSPYIPNALKRTGEATPANQRLRSITKSIPGPLEALSMYLLQLHLCPTRHGVLAVLFINHHWSGCRSWRRYRVLCIRNKKGRVRG